MGFLPSCLALLFFHGAAAHVSSSGDCFSAAQQQPIQRSSGLDRPHYPRLDPATCRYPELEKAGYRRCTGKSKSCWLSPPGCKGKGKSYDVWTDYEETVPIGVTREYHITIDRTPDLSPDGQPKTNGVTANGTYPGPTIEACWGDEIVVHVRNQYRDNGTTIHWHGIRQLHSNEMDGVNGVTQCPIARGEEFVYRFRATQYGHSWYHSHYSLQYPDGVAGPLVIHGPTSAEWDVDLGPVMVADWIHDTAFNAFNCEAYQCPDGGSPPKVDNIVVNGVGSFRQPDGQFTDHYFNTTFKPGKKHLLRLINAAESSAFVFSIDNHTMTVVASDLVPVKPYQTDSLLLAIGQRYTVVVEANQKPGRYWMRTAPADGCNAFRTDEEGAFTQVRETTAFVTYEGAPQLPPLPDSSSVKQKDITDECVDESLQHGRLQPVVPWAVTQPSNNVSRDSFTAALEQSPNPALFPQKPYAHWLLANDSHSSPLWVNFSHPTILDPFADPPFSGIVRFEQSTGFVYIIVDGQYLFDPSSEFLFVPAAHPIHLHGSDFVILAQNTTPYDPRTSPAHFEMRNPPRRDTAMLPAGGYLALAFKPDNPGVWILHCHIVNHASSGFALQLVVRPKDMPKDLRPVEKGCESWRRREAKDPVVQKDSGI